MSKNKGLVILNTLTLATMLLANYGANAGMFSVITVGEVSHKYDTLFAPAGYAFSIWGLLFLLCIGFVAHQWTIVNNDSRQYITRTGVWFSVGNVANTLWLYCWTNEIIGLSVFLIIILLVSLCVLIVRLRLELDDEPVRTILFVWWPLTLYAGWIMVATIACIAAWLVYSGWQGGPIGEEAWTMIMIVTASVLYLLLIRTRNMREAASVGIWAFTAIAIRQWQANRNIVVTAITCSVILLIASLIHGYRGRYYSPGEKIKRGEWK